MSRVVQRKEQSVAASSKASSESRGGVALQPPSYGIEFADRAGEQLPGSVRSKMERAFASDFSGVRIHHGTRARSIGAVACTEGSHIHFAPGHYQPHTELGQATIGHELAHVVQQSRGMVQANRQLGGVALNDSPRLERQADIAGARAALGRPTGMLGGSSAASPSISPPVQREIVGNNLKEVIAWQKRLQAQVEQNPAQSRFMYTTVGFEHEFGQMEDDQLHGVDHLELAEASEPKLNKLAFILETDASNSVELVSPPFLLPTKSSGNMTPKSKRKPAPIAEDVYKLDGMFQAVLSKAVDFNKVPDPNAKEWAIDPFIYTTKTLAEIAADLKDLAGIEFSFADVEVEPYQLSPATKHEFDKDSAEISRQTVAGIHVAPSHKGSKSNDPHIISQVNFATDVVTADLLQRAADADADLLPKNAGDIGKKLRTAEDTIRTALISNTRPSANLTIFYNALARSLSGQIAVPYMAYFKEAQELAFAEKTKMSELEDYPVKALELAENISSHVKDTSGIWVKDMVVNLGLGILIAREWSAVFTRVNDGSVIKEITEATAIDMGNDWPEKLRETTRAAIAAETTAALNRVSNIIENDIKPNTGNFDQRVKGLHFGQQENERRLEFAQHDPDNIGPRQDTYIRSKNVQMPLWQKRLHVVETRADSIEAQTELIKKANT